MKISATVHAQFCEYTKEYRYVVFNHDDMSEQGYIAVHTTEIEFVEPPREALISGTVAAFRAEQRRIEAEATARVTDLQRQINEMLCIEHKPDPVDA